MLTKQSDIVVQEDQVDAYLSEYHASEFAIALATKDIKKIDALKNRVTLYLVSEKYKTFLKMYQLGLD